MLSRKCSNYSLIKNLLFRTKPFVGVCEPFFLAIRNDAHKALPTCWGKHGPVTLNDIHENVRREHAVLLTRGC